MMPLMGSKLRQRFEEIARRSLWTPVLMVVAAVLFFLLAPVFTSDADRLPALIEARSALFSSVYVGLVVIGTLSAVGLSMIATESADRVVRFIARRRGVPDAYRRGIPDKLRNGVLLVAICAPTLAVVFVILMKAWFLFLHAPSTSNFRVTHLDAVDIQEFSMIGAGAYSFNRPNARVVGAYLAVKDNVIEPGLPVRQVFAEPLGSVDDIEISQGTLFVVTGRNLLAVIDKKLVKRIAELPLPGMRFGRRVYPGGLMPELLLSGNDGTGGHVYELYPDGTNAKLADTGAYIVGAAGCMDTTVVAYAEHLVQLSPGYYPRLLFRAPQSSGPITSIAARLAKGGEAADCLWLVATRNGVYAVQDGAATLLIAGFGGNLSVGEKRMAFQLTDPQRNGSIEVTFNE